MALLIFHSSCIGYVLSLVRMGFHGTFKLRLLFGIPLIGFLVEDLYKIQLYSLMFLWGFGILGLTCPFIAVSVRRLHDSGLSGWHFFWRLIPYIGSVITFVLMLRKSKAPYRKK